MNNKTVKNFNGVPRTKMRRTRFTPKGNVKTSFNAGDLVPLLCREVLPNTTMQLDLTSVVRGLTPYAPVLDNAYCDVFAFFVPNRLSWEHWEDFLSEPEPRAYEEAPQYSVPHITFSSASSTATYQNSLANTFWDYANVGAAKKDVLLSNMPSLSALYPRGYVRIYNEWFRDQNIQDSAHLYLDDTDRSFDTNSDPNISAEFGGALFKVDKYKDYFTSALPQPQKGAPITVSLGTRAYLGGFAPVVDSSTIDSGVDPRSHIFNPTLYSSMGTVLDPNLRLSTYKNGLTPPKSGLGVDGTIDQIRPENNVGAYMGLGVNLNGSYSPATRAFADLSTADGITVNALRLAFQSQRFQERLARGGSRYTELLRSMFGVYASDSRLQRSEYLGGRRFPITQHQVAQTSENEADASQFIGLGDTGAFVFANDDRNRIIDRSFPEHGILYVLACVRTDQTYSQGVPVELTRRNRFDYYFPCFAHIGEQPIYMREIYNANNSLGKSVFGYKEAWVEYKYLQNRVTAHMRPYVDANFGVWTYANNFAVAPTLTPKFLQQGLEEVDRTLRVTSDLQHQFFGDFYFDFRALDLCMPAYNEPGLIDHY